MGPSRRKGSSRASSAAATAAACRKWKVGDLVLAKVKGFPAWPAMVSAPEKWGYVASWKKVLVHFFGTQQIAFCNPADIEAFTEERKETLLVRRHGKGADFIRAVHEIIESYEESKKLEQVVDIDYVDEAAATNAENLDNDTALKDQFDSPYTMVSYGVNKSYSTREKNKPSLTVGDAADAAFTDVGGRDASSEGPIDRSVVTKKPRANILFSEKECGDVEPQSSSSQKRNSSACRSRSSSRVYTSRFQKPILSSSNGKAEDIAAKVLQNGFVRRSKRISKSPDVSDVNDTGSPVFLSNGSNGENGSEIVRVDLDTFSLTEGTTVKSGCKPLQSESIVECRERDVELRQAPSFQTKSVVLKKKRKPNRKRMSNGDPENIGSLNKADAEVDMHKTGQVLPISHERYSKEDGDEHLPLVKRARVRMGKPSSVKEELDTVIQSEDKVLEVSNNFSRRVSTQLQEQHGPDQNSFVIDGATENALLPNKGSPSPAQLLPQLRDANKKQFVCSVDGEAALPPSKRLHRALEAMSANAAEDGQTEEPSSTEMLTNGGCSLSITDSPHMCMKSRVSNEFGLQNVDILSNNAPQSGAHGISDICGPADGKESVESFKDVTICSEPVISSCSPEHELCKDIHMDAGDHFDSRGIVFSLSGSQTSEVVTVALSPKPLSPDPVEKETCLGCKQGSLAHMFFRKGECRNDNSESEFTDLKAENPLNELDPSDNSAMSSDPVSTAVDRKFLPQNDTDLLPCSTEGNCSGSSKLWKLPLHANNQVDGMCEAVKDIKRTQRESNGIQTPASMKVMAPPTEGPPTFFHSNSVSENHFGDKDVSGLLLSSTEVMKEIKPTQKESNGVRTPTAMKAMAAPAEGPPNLSHSSSVSDDHLSDKDVSGIRPSSTPAHVDSLACPSPATTSICNTSTSDNDNILDNNGCCSPDVHLRHAKSKIISKWSNKAEAAVALASFQSAIGTLTRTKESIGRATRIAIDCAKFGVAAKVVEILVRDLQSESSLRRKVDLFFLVDSITQCSRSCRGGIGCIYPTAIQSVLPRLLLAAAPPGSDTQENRRQCLKVLRLWLERSILPDSVVRRHIRDLESFGVSSSSRRPLRTERAFDDPIRQMEGMLVDEYGSNSSFHLPGFPMLKDEVDGGSDSDCGSFEAVTPEHDTEKGNHTHILEDVDGELEMEDVAPTCEAVSTSNACVNTSLSMLEQQFPSTFVPHIPKVAPPLFPPLPTSPPPPLPSLPPMSPIPDAISDSNFYEFVSQQSVVNSDAVLYQSPESREADSNPVPHQPIVFVNGVQQTYHLPPPQQTPSNQFSYIQADQQVKSLREVPPLPPPSPYPNRAHFAKSTDGGGFYTDHDKLKMIPQEHRGESWKFPGTSFHGSLYPDHPAGGSYPPAPYSGSPRLTTQGWSFPTQAMNHTEFMPQRPPSRGQIPAANRGIIRF